MNSVASTREPWATSVTPVTRRQLSPCGRWLSKMDVPIFRRAAGSSLTPILWLNISKVLIKLRHCYVLWTKPKRWQTNTEKWEGSKDQDKPLRNQGEGLAS